MKHHEKCIHYGSILLADGTECPCDCHRPKSLSESLIRLTKVDMNKDLDIIKETIVNYICSLANVDNPDKAEKSIKDTIWGQEPPQYSAPKLIALGKVQGALTALSIVSNYEPK